MTQRNQVNRTFAVLLNKEGDFYRQAVDSPRAAQALRRAVKLHCSVQKRQTHGNALM